MGREAQVACTIGTHTEGVKVLLESTELILRGPTLRRRYPRAALQQLQVAGEALQFSAAGEHVSLALGAPQARKWLDQISRPPPTLAAKLGVSATQPAMVVGPAADDAALAAALHGATTTDPQAAAMLLAVVLCADDLARAVALHARMAAAALWVVHVKGRSSALGDAAIRADLRARGYVDHKTSAVSERLTATRWRRP